MSSPSSLKSSVNVDIPPNPDPNASRRVQMVIADTYSFIRGAEANKAISAITFEELISDQIKRNGTSDEAQAAQFTPYDYDPENSAKPAGLKPQEKVLSAGGSDVGRPSKLSRLLAIKSVLSSTIDAVKKLEPLELSDEKAYADSAEDATPTEAEELT